MTGRWAAHSDKSDAPPETDVPAVAYVRMSTDHQKYSTENQLDIIRNYATARGLQILRVFEDSGRSGLRLDGREALQNLMAEVRTGQADFKAILVYDVSRWGRFQDADEGAYHEHVCSRAGIRVHYCGEQFENDGSIGSNLLKTVKRVMAGEYSRELSVKVFAGQCRLVELGYRQGGAAGYGLRRVLIDEHGNPKGALSRGQQKSFQTDRVVLVPGPEQEQDVVRSMYRMFVEDGRSEREIAETLNAEGHLTDLERPWSRASVHQVLTNEKYIGNNVYNKVSFKLKQRRVVNPREMWIRAEGAYPAIVDEALFLRAREIVDARSQHFTDAELLEALRGVLKQKGVLSGLIIDEQDNVPSSSAFRNRFGSLLRAYQMIGYEPERDYRYVEINRALRQAHPGIVAQILDGVAERGGQAVQDPGTDLIRINDEFTASVVLARCFETQGGSLIVADKFQTGYDEPLLHTMYVDKTLSGIKAVQTLSRLNRAHPQKHDTFVLDFMNDVDSIKASFEDYYRTTILSEETDPNKLHDLKARLDGYQVYSWEQVEDLVALYLGGADRDKLDPILDACVAVYKADLDEDGQVDFKGKAKAFTRTYGFLAAILPYTNAEWEKLSIFLNFLTPKLPAPEEQDLSKGILEAIDMDSYRVEAQATMSIALPDADAEIGPVPLGGGGRKPEPELDFLSNILKTFNEMFGNIDWKDVDKIGKVIAEELPTKVAADKAYQNAMQNSDKQNARIEHDKALERAVIELLSDHTELFKQFSDNPSFKKWLSETIFAATYAKKATQSSSAATRS